MKNLLIVLFITSAFFTACKEKSEPQCPTVNAELVPLIVKDSFTVHYPGITVETWYQVDTIGFCAKFLQSSNTVFAHLGTEGTFKEVEILDAKGKEIDNDDIQDEHNNDDENSCECH